MAIYSLNVASVGKSTHAPGTAGAHVRYIAREDACSHLVGEHMPTEPAAARAWMDIQERDDRKNARVIDKLRVAIPRELNAVQRAELIRAFVIDVTGGRTPWLAAIHQTGDDEHNPHAHIIVRDRDIETHKRVLRWSDSPRDREKLGLPPNAVDHIRQRWEALANEALARAGHSVRIDRRTLEAQGIDRIPTIHVGPQAQHIDETVSKPVSKMRPQRKRRLRRGENPSQDKADYPKIDAGRTRKERNAEIIDLNLEREARSSDFFTRERARFLRGQIRQDRMLERELIAENRLRTRERRETKAGFRKATAAIRSEWETDRKTVRTQLASRWHEDRQSLATKQNSERQTLKAQQDRLGARLMRFLDLTGGTRRRHSETRQTLLNRHKDERQTLARTHRELRTASLLAVDSKHEPHLSAKRHEAAEALAKIRARHREEVTLADRRRQERASARERETRQFEAGLDAVRGDRDKAAISVAQAQGSKPMPRDRDGNWVPESHKADGYTGRQKEGANKTLADFNAARAGEAQSQKQALAMKPEAANKVMARDFRPGGQTQMRNTAQGEQREKAARESVEAHREMAGKDTSRAYRKQDIAQKFNNQLDRGKMGRTDIER